MLLNTLFILHIYIICQLNPIYHPYIMHIWLWPNKFNKGTLCGLCFNIWSRVVWHRKCRGSGLPSNIKCFDFPINNVRRWSKCCCLVCHFLEMPCFFIGLRVENRYTLPTPITKWTFPILYIYKCEIKNKEFKNDIRNLIREVKKYIKQK